MSTEHIEYLEQQIGIKRVELPDTVLQQTREEVAKMADILHVDSPVVTPPDRGVVRQALRADQERVVDGILSQQYAREAMQLQSVMASVPVRETGERMVSLPQVFADAGIQALFSDRPFPDVCEEYGGKPRIYYVRESVAPVLIRIGSALESLGLRMKVEDGFRPPEVTRGLRVRRFSQFIFPDHAHTWSIEQMITEADSKTANRPRLAGHSAGAALDYTIVTAAGEPLDLGNTYGKGGAGVALKYPYVTADQWRTRTLFTHASRLAGGFVYPYEDWHTNTGDSIAGVTEQGSTLPGYSARFGPVRRFDPVDGSIEPYRPEEYDDLFLPVAEIEAMLIRYKEQ